jgi:hypothetical protein
MCHHFFFKSSITAAKVKKIDHKYSGGENKVCIFKGGHRLSVEKGLLILVNNVLPPTGNFRKIDFCFIIYDMAFQNKFLCSTHFLIYKR